MPEENTQSVSVPPLASDRTTADKPTEEKPAEAPVEAVQSTAAPAAPVQPTAEQEQPETAEETPAPIKEKTAEPATETEITKEEKQEAPEEIKKPDISPVQPVPDQNTEPVSPAKEPISASPSASAQPVPSKAEKSAAEEPAQKKPNVRTRLSAFKSAIEKTAAQPPEPRIISPKPNSPIIKPILSFLDKLKELRQKANLARQENKQTNLEKIMAFAREKQKITNNDVEKLTGVKDRQATNYLAELTKKDLLTRFGQKKNTFYKPIKK